MSDDSLIDTKEVDKRKKMAIAVSLVLVMLQIMLLLAYRSYLDFGHLLLTIIYMVMSLFVFLSLLKAKIIPAILSIVLATVLLYGEIVKVQWNQSYLRGLATPNAFILEDYIEAYPTLEQYVFSRTLHQKDWVRLAEYCVEPALKGRPIMRECRDAAWIQDVYNIDVQEEIELFLVRMQKTAKDVKDGRIKSGNQYQQCIAQKRCAPIPLLPEDVKAEGLANDSTQYADIRKAFWDLADGKMLNETVCASMTLCRAMMIAGVISFGGSPTPEDDFGVSE